VGGKDLLTVTGTFDAEAARQAGAIDGAQVVSAESGRLLLSVEGGRGTVEALTAVLASKLQAEGITIQPPSLSTLFLNLTGRELRD